MKNNATHTYEKHLKHVKGVTKKTAAVSYEDQMYAMFHRKLSELSMNRFKWSGLPENIDKRFIEKTLLETGLILFYLEEEYDKYFCVPAAPKNLDHQLNPTSYQVVTANNFINREVDADISVPIWANYSRSTDTDIIQIYAARLARLDRTVDINLNNARQPKMLLATPETQLSVENFNKQVEEGQYVVRVRQDLQDNVKALDMGVNPDLFEKVSLARTRIWNECMGLLGIKHANQDKKERLVSDEVAANDEQISYMKAVNLNARKIAVEEINRKFNLNISVEYDDDLDTALTSLESVLDIDNSENEFEEGEN